MSTTTTDRELRDRLEALEVEVKRLSTERHELHQALSDSTEHMEEFERREVRVFAWLGRQHDFVRMLLQIAVTTVPILAVALISKTSGHAPYFVFSLTWILFAFLTFFPMIRGARALHLVCAAVRRSRR